MSKIEKCSKHPHNICNKCEYILDIYFEKDITHVWTKNLDGELKHYPILYHPKIYVSGDIDYQNDFYLTRHNKGRSIEQIAKGIKDNPNIISMKYVDRYLDSAQDKPTKCLEIEVRSPKTINQIVKSFKLQSYLMFNIDINPRQQFFLDTGTRPLTALHLELLETSQYGQELLSNGENEKFYWLNYQYIFSEKHEGYEFVSTRIYDDLTALDFEIPILTALDFKINIKYNNAFPTVDDPIDSIELMHKKYSTKTLIDLYQEESIVEKYYLCGDEPTIIRDLISKIKELDPDILLVRQGDKFILNYLANRAYVNQLSKELIMGRLENKPLYPTPDAKGQSYMTYGQIVHRDPVKYIPGRINLDVDNSFFLHESGIAGMIELARLSGTPPVRVSRASIGTVLTGIEMLVNNSSIPPALIPPNKALGEKFKPSTKLLIADNGGLTYPALPGIYDQVWSIDFTSLYPFIMLKHNIGSETVLCEHESCSDPETAIIVPEVEYHICKLRESVVTKTMSQVLQKRVLLKLSKKRFKKGAQKNRYKQIDSAMKWILVSCFEGSTRVLVRKNGVYISERLDVIVNEHLVSDKLEALGMDEYGLPEFKPVKNVIKIHPKTSVYRIKFKGCKLTIATADHLWPVITEDGWQNIRTDQLNKHHNIPRLEKFDLTNQAVLSLIETKSLQIAQRESTSKKKLIEKLEQKIKGSLRATDIKKSRLEWLRVLYNAPILFTHIVSMKKLENPPDYVYCLELDSPTPWFMIQGNLITHNCFGYLGFKNARWGSIESHQCVTAYARRYLLQAKTICEEHDFQVIGGIVDSLFIKAKEDKNNTKQAISELMEDINYKMGIPIDCEGRFQWVVFGNIRHYTGVSALNRYFGYFDHGEFKLRGIRHRQRRVTILEKKFQDKVLNLLKPAKNVDEFMQLIPKAEKILFEWKDRLWKREFHPNELLIKIKSHKGSGNYKALNTHQAIVTSEYLKEGRNIEAGENIRYLVKNDKAHGSNRIIIEANVDENSVYDAEWYGILLERAFLELVESPQYQKYGKLLYTGKEHKTILSLNDFDF